jgi:DNA-binding MarR family transcriptional regulator
MGQDMPIMPAAKALAPVPVDNALRELVRTFGLLERVMQPYFARFGITGAQWGVLRNLHRSEQEGLSGLRQTDLGERLLVRPPSITGVVDRLERAGLVTRDSLATDLRAKHVALTPGGRQVVERILRAHQAHVDRLMGGLEQDEQAELLQLLRKLAGHLESLARPGTRPQAPSGG